MRFLLVCCLFFSTVSIAQVNLTNGLVAYYQFSGNANDASGNNINGSVVNATLTTDRFGNSNSAYLFDGSSSYIQLPYSNLYNFSPSGSFSISVWLQPQLNSLYGAQALVVKSPPNSNYHASFWNYGSYLLNDKFMTGYSNTNFLVSNTSITFNQCWYNYVFTYNDGIWKMYINGVLEKSETSQNYRILQDGANSKIGIGRKGEASGDYYKGKLDEIRIYNRILSQAEVSAIYDNYDCANATAVNASFTALDTVCVNSSVSLINTSSNATTHYWSFGYPNFSATPTGINYGNINGNFGLPVFTEFANDNGTWYGLVVNNSPGGLVRLNFGNSILNTPTSTNLGNFVGNISNSSQGIQLVRLNNKWIAIIVGGDPADGSSSRILKLDFGNSLANTPVITNWGNVGNLDYPTDIYVFNQNGSWYGIVDNYWTGTLTRFSFGTDFSGVPTAVNLGSFAGMNLPSGICPVKAPNGNWSIFVCNYGGNNISRIDFGNSLLNNPISSTNLGNIGGILNQPRDMNIMVDCGQIIGYMLNGGNNALLKLNFLNDILTTPTVTSLGNIGNLSAPHSISKITRVDNDLYGFIQNVGSNSLTRIKFSGSTSISQPSSTLQTPPLFSYTAPGVYNINLSVDEGLPTQSSYCKQIVVVAKPNVDAGSNVSVCPNEPVQINATSSGTSYSWSPLNGVSNANILNPVITTAATAKYYLTASNGYCSNQDSITITIAPKGNLSGDFNFTQDVCNPKSYKFYGVTANTTSFKWLFDDGLPASTILNPSVVYNNYGNRTVKFILNSNYCTDTITKIIKVALLSDGQTNINASKLNLCPGDSSLLEAPVALNYCWTPAATLNNSGVNNPIAKPTSATVYYLNSTRESGSLFSNGTFSAGNNGFTSDYIYATNNTTQAQYAIGTNAQLWNASLASCTNVNQAGYMMVNANNVIGATVWKQSGINIKTNTDYIFSVKITSLKTGNAAKLKFSINNTIFSPDILAGSNTCSWNQFFIVWNSGNKTTATIALLNNNAVSGSYFALDDISFGEYILRRDTIKLSMFPLIPHNPTKNVEICQDDSTILKTAYTNLNNLWNNGTTDSITTVKNAGYYWVQSTNGACFNTDSFYVKLNAKPAISLSSNVSMCENTSAQLIVTGSNTYTYNWSPVTALSNPNIQSPVANPLTTTQYVVKATDLNGCKTFDTVLVDVKPKPVFSISPVNTGFCKGDSVLIKVSQNADTYQWLGNNISSPTAASSVVKPITSSVYKVVVKSVACNLQDTLTANVDVYPNPVIKASKSNDIDCNQLSATLNATGGVSYLWYPSTGLSANNIANPVATIQSSRTYKVIGVSDKGCKDSATVNVQVLTTGNNQFYLPDAFTPNGDGLNDCFGVKNWGFTTKFDMSIYNRYGQVIFKTTDATECWNGSFNGIPQPTGTYVYMISAETPCGKTFKKGTVVLLR